MVLRYTQRYTKFAVSWRTRLHLASSPSPTPAMPMEGFVKHVDDSSASLLLNNPEVAPWERRAGRVGLGFSSEADEVIHTNRARRSRSRSRTRDRGRDHQRARRSRSRSRDRQRDHRNRRSRSRERHGRRRSRPRSRSRNRRSSRSRSRSGNRRDRDHDRHGQSRVPHDEGRTRDVRDVRPSGSSRHEAPAPVSGAALSIAQKLKARAEAKGKERGAGSWATQQATQLALRDTIRRDDNQRGGGWEQFDLNKMNYELETKGAMVSDQRKAVLAAIDGESECIRDEIDEDQYHRHSSTGVSSQDDRHMANIFGSTAGP